MVRGKFSIAKLQVANYGGKDIHTGDRSTTDSVGIGVKNLSVVKAWVGEIPRAPYVSTETIAYDTMSCDCG